MTDNGRTDRSREGATAPAAPADAGAPGGALSARGLLHDSLDFRALRSSRHGIAPVILLAMVGFVQTFDTSIFGLLLPEIRRDFGTSLSVITSVTGMVGAAVILSGPLIGWLADRVKRTTMIGVSTIISGAFALLSGSAPSLPMLAVARGLDDFGETAGHAPAASLIADYYPPELRGKAFALQQLMGKITLSLAPLTVGALAAAFGWRAPFVVAGPLLMAGGLVALVKLREPVRGYWERTSLGADEAVANTEEPPMRFAEAFRALRANKTMSRIALAYAVTTIGTSWFSVLFSFFLNEKFGLNPFERGLVSVPATIAAMIGVLFGGGLTDRLLQRRPGRMLAIVGSVTLLTLPGQIFVVLSQSLAVLIVMSVLGAFVGGLLAPASFSVFTMVLPPRLRGQGLGILGLAVLPSLALRGVSGSLAQSYGLTGGMLLALPVIAVGAVLYISASPLFESDRRAALSASMASADYRKAKAQHRIKLLVCRGVDVHYGSVQVLFDVDFEADEGEIIALLGTNGAGKSTLLRAISGTQEASNGAVVFDGRDITHLPPYEIARIGVVHMPGGRGVFPGLTVGQNLDLALWSAPRSDWDAARDTALAYFPVLRDLLDKPAGLLSGGEQQMVALSQAFLARPRLLMIDELSLGLAPAVVQQLLEIIRAIHALGTTVILVEQSVNVALTIAQRAVFLEKGTVRFEGATRDLLARPDIMRAVYVKGSAALAGAGGTVRRADSSTSNRPLLEVTGITKQFGGVTAVNGVTFTLHEGEAIGLIGPNGAGKTTIFDLVSGYQPVDSGRVILDGVDVTDLSADARARLQLIRRFQDARLFPALTVLESITVALERKLDVRNTFVTALQLPSVRRGERRVRAQADRLIELFDLGSFRDKFVSDLSTGLRRIVDLACVVAAEPKVLLLDEPSSGIAQAEAENLAPLLRRVRYETGCSLLIIEHDVTLITNVADELIGLVQGSVVAQGPADDVLAHPVLVEAYLGSSEAALHRQGVLPS